MKYSDSLVEWLCEAGYTHCFYVPGGNIMHLINSANQHMECIGFVHEVGATIAAEYFNEVSRTSKAFVLVTAGPGLTNAITGMAGAHLESRRLLVIGGQVKTADLSHGTVRQKGLQEVDGVALAKPTSKLAVRLDRMVGRETFLGWIGEAESGRPGCVFVEACLDVQGAPVEKPAALSGGADASRMSLRRPEPTRDDVAVVREKLKAARRPVLLLGGGLAREATDRLLPELEPLGVPVMTTWNGADRVPADHPLYFGRPNNWGQRYSNILINQADLVIALGTRLNVQQTGFNWQGFVGGGEIIQVDVDMRELTKGHPRIAIGLAVDAGAMLEAIVQTPTPPAWSDWVDYCRKAKALLPLTEQGNVTGDQFVSPYDFVSRLSEWAAPGDNVIPCSSGGAFTVMMQVFAQKAGQHIVTNKSLASMGYGLSGAIGAAIAYPDRRTILTEGDGGFAQNLQELGTVAVNMLNMKIFIFDDRGYASIRSTQRNYFNGRYFGCDKETGLGLPNWEKLFAAYDIPAMRLGPDNLGSPEFHRAFECVGPAAFIVTVDPEQTYFPKILSRVTASGSMESPPFHLISPELPPEISEQVFEYLK